MCESETPSTCNLLRYDIVCAAFASQGKHHGAYPHSALSCGTCIRPPGPYFPGVRSDGCWEQGFGVDVGHVRGA